MWGAALGIWLALLDAVLAIPERASAGDRVGVMAVALGLDAAAMALVAGLATLVAVLGVRLLRRGATSNPGYETTARIPACIGGFGVVVGLLVALLGAKSPVAGPLVEPEAPPNVVLISVDTLRADHLSAYGYPRDTSPHLRELANRGVTFDAAYSHSTWTLPAHASMLTGLDPFAHGVVKLADGLNPRVTTLAQRLQGAGYQTVAWVGTRDYGFVGASRGFDAGFDHYRHFPHPKRYRSSRLASVLDTYLLEGPGRSVGNARDQTDSVLSWLRVRERRPFFLFIHYYDVHAKHAYLPYEAPPPHLDLFCPGGADEFRGCVEGQCAVDRLTAISQRKQPPLDEAELAVVRCLYDGGVSFVDEQIGRLLGSLERDGTLDRTLVIVTSDHGEAFLEHGRLLHVTLHDEVTRIPLLMRLPGGAQGKRVAGVVGLVDIVPTVLEAVGLGVGRHVQGTSLLEVLRSWSAEIDGEVIAYVSSNNSALLRSGSLKYIRVEGRRGLLERLYDLSRDAGETWNAAEANPEAVDRMAEALAARRRASEALHTQILGNEPPIAVEITESQRERLRALGYAIDD